MPATSTRLRQIVHGRGGVPSGTTPGFAGLWLLLLAMALVGSPCVPARARQAPVNAPPAQAEGAPKAGPVYDGDWWLMLYGQEQTGVIAGYQDCYISEYHGDGLFNKEIQNYVDDVNKYFLADATRQKQTVSEALDAVRGAGTDAPLPAYKAAMPPPADQAVYDGRYWQDADASTKLGFVEGYLACHGAKLKDADAKFSKAPVEYVDGINQAYLSAENTGDTQTDKTARRIAAVLHSLKDPENPPAKPAS